MCLPRRTRHAFSQPQDSSIRSFIQLDETAFTSGSLKRLKSLQGSFFPRLFAPGLLDRSLRSFPVEKFYAPNFDSECPFASVCAQLCRSQILLYLAAGVVLFSARSKTQLDSRVAVPSACNTARISPLDIQHVFGNMFCLFISEQLVLV